MLGVPPVTLLTAGVDLSPLPSLMEVNAACSMELQNPRRRGGFMGLHSLSIVWKTMETHITVPHSSSLLEPVHCSRRALRMKVHQGCTVLLFSIAFFTRKKSAETHNPPMDLHSRSLLTAGDRLLERRTIMGRGVSSIPLPLSWPCCFYLSCLGGVCDRNVLLAGGVGGLAGWAASPSHAHHLNCLVGDEGRLRESCIRTL